MARKRSSVDPYLPVGDFIRTLADAWQVSALTLSVSASLDEALGELMEQLRRMVPFDSGCVMLVEGESASIKVWKGYHHFTDPGSISQVRFEVPNNQTVGEVVRTGEPLMIQNVQQDPRWQVMRVSDHVQSWLGLPLKVRDQVIGLLSLDRVSPEGFNALEMSVAQAFALHASTAIQNVRLIEAEEQRSAELLAVRQAAFSLSSSLELRTVLHSVMESALRLLPGAFAAQIYLYQSDEAGEHVTFGASLGQGEQGQFIPESCARQIVLEVARSGAPLVMPDLSADLVHATLSADEQLYGSVVSLPLTLGQRLLGVMILGYPSQHFFSEAELRVLSMLSDQAASAIQNASLFEQAELERRRLRLLYDLGRELKSSLNADEILSQAARLTCQSFGGLVGNAFLYEPSSGRLFLRALFGKEVVRLDELNERIHFTIGKGLTGWVAEHIQPVIVSDVTQDERWLPVKGLDDQVRSVIMAPVHDEFGLMGVLVVAHDQPAAFTPESLELLVAVSQQVALALSNAERYQQVQSLVERLAAEQYRLESLLERLPVGVLLLDEGHNLLIANLLARKFLSYLEMGESGGPLVQLGSYPIADLLGRPADALPVEIVLSRSPRLVVEAEARRLGGETLQWALTVRDVTQERENQEQIRMQERLATVGQMAAGIAHDFNNILAAILVYTDLLSADKNLSSSSRARLRIIEEQVQRAASLIRQVLDFSRRSVMEQSPMDLLPFLKELVKLLGRVLPETIHIESFFEPGMYFVNGDPTRLQQVFMNLVLNSRDAMPEGGRLRLEMSRFSLKAGEASPNAELYPGDWIRIEVIDTGIGIPPEVLPKIFDPFFTTKSVGQGTGLGLSQVYGIVKQHGGCVDVKSSVGEGTRFTIYLPALVLVREEVEYARELPELRGGGQTLLIVEDDPSTRNALSDLLRAYEFRVLAARNGQEALELFEEHSQVIPLVITDVVMPGMGGPALYHQLRERWPEVKVLFVTGHPLEAESQALLEKGHVHWLQKPFSVQEFAVTLRELLN
jgi:signal transduction histidine kinase/CheY-like chemotaxis protein